MNIKVFWDGSALDNHLKTKNPRRCFGAYTIGDDEFFFESPQASTSNQAEYDALIAALEHILKTPNYEKNHYDFKGDSSVAVYQIKGTWRVNSKALKARREKVLEMLSKLDYDISTVDRDHNPAGHLIENKLKIRNLLKNPRDSDDWFK